VFFYYRNFIEAIGIEDQPGPDEIGWSPSEALYFLPLPRTTPHVNQNATRYIIREPAQTESFLDPPVDSWSITRYHLEDVPGTSYPEDWTLSRLPVF
jgi:hypothetical protein